MTGMGWGLWTCWLWSSDCEVKLVRLGRSDKSCNGAKCGLVIRGSWEYSGAEVDRGLVVGLSSTDAKGRKLSRSDQF